MSALTRKYPMLGSSVDPEKLSLTIKGILLGVTPLVLLIAGSLKVDIGPEQWQNFVELLWQWSNQITLAVSTGMTVFGLIRKGLIWLRYR